MKAFRLLSKYYSFLLYVELSFQESKFMYALYYWNYFYTPVF